MEPTDPWEHPPRGEGALARAGDTGGSEPDGVFAAPVRTLTVGLVLTITLVAFEALAVATVMPVVSDELGGLDLYGWVFSGFFLGNLAGIVVAGDRADQSGLAAPFAAGLVLFAGGLLAGGLAPTMGVLVAARVAQGLGAGAIPAVAYVAVGRGYPQSLQPRLFAIFSSAWVVPGLIGPAASGAIADHSSWRYVFLGLLPLVILAGAMTLPSLRRFGTTSGGVPGNGRAVFALLVTTGAGLVLAAASAGSVVLGVPLALAGAGIGFAGFTRLVPAGTLRLRPGLPAAVLVRGILTFSFFGVDAYVSLALTSTRGTSTTVAGIALTVATLGWATGAWVQERLVRRHGPRVLVRGGFALILLGCGGIASVMFPAVPLAVGMAVWGVAGLGMGIAYAPLSLTVLGLAPDGREGASTAALQLCDVLGIALGTGASGAAVAMGEAAGMAPRTMLLIAFAVAASVAVTGFAASRRLPSALS